MPIPATGDIMQITLRGDLFDQKCLTVLHYEIILLGTEATQDELATGIWTFLRSGTSGLYDLFLDCISEDYFTMQTIIQTIFPVRYTAIFVNTIDTNGSIASPSMPPGVSSAITKRAGIAGPTGVGGVRMPGVPRTHVSAGALTAPAKAILQTFADELPLNILTALGTELKPIIFHRAVPAVSRVIETATVQPTSRTMSRRVVGRGI